MVLICNLEYNKIEGSVGKGGGLFSEMHYKTLYLILAMS